MAYSAGLYLGVDFVDLVVMGVVRGRPSIIKSVRADYKEASDSIRMDKISTIASAVNKAISRAGIKTRSVNFSMPQDEVIVRRFTMPYLPSEERSSAVRFEAQKYMPFKLDETLSDFFIAAESQISKKMDVVFVAANRNSILKYTDILEKLKIGMGVIEVIPTALLRLLTACKKITNGQTRIVVYLEKNTRGSIIIIREKNVYLVREISLSASKDIFFENLLNNIRLSVDYFKRETKEVEVNNIIVCADAGGEELGMYLKENIGSAEIETFNLQKEIDGLNDLARKQIVAIGLAMASLDKTRPKINLSAQLQKETVVKGITEYRPLIMEGVALFLIVALLQVFANLNLNLARKKLAQLKADSMMMMNKEEGKEKGEEELTLVELRGKGDNVVSQIEFFKNFAGEKRFFLTKKLSLLGRLLPKEAWVESLQFTDEVNRTRRLSINGLIYSKEKDGTDIANSMFVGMKNLEEFNFGFKDIRLSSLQRTEAYNTELLAFSIECVGQALISKYK